MVILEGNVRGPEKDLELFISQSPLAHDRIIKYANQSLVAGYFDMDLDMSIPIKAPQLQSVITGKLKLEEAKLVSDVGSVELEQVNGDDGLYPGIRFRTRPCCPVCRPTGIVEHVRFQKQSV